MKLIDSQRMLCKESSMCKADMYNSLVLYYIRGSYLNTCVFLIKQVLPQRLL